MFGVGNSSLGLSSSKNINLRLLRNFCSYKVVVLPFWFFIGCLFVPELFVQGYCEFLCKGEPFSFVEELADQRFVSPFGFSRGAPKRQRIVNLDKTLISKIDIYQ